MPDSNRKTSLLETDESWLDVHEGSGYLHPDRVAPDPNQPREHIRDIGFQELCISVKDKGIRNPVIVTPTIKAPWVELADEDNHLTLVTVSGHRRLAAATKVGLQSVPVIVRIYKSEAEYESDALLLNALHADLAAMEEARYFDRMLKKGVHTLASISSAYGKNSTSFVYGRIQLVKLSPKLQAMLDPSLGKANKIQVSVATALGKSEVPTKEEVLGIIAYYGVTSDPAEVDLAKLFASGNDDQKRFFLQDLLLDIATRHAHNNVQNMIKIISGETIKLESYQSGGLGAQRAPRGLLVTKLPSKLRRFLSLMDSDTPLQWDQSTVDRYAYNQPALDIDEVVNALNQRSYDLHDLAETIKESAASKPHATPHVDAMIKTSYTSFGGEVMVDKIVPRTLYVQLWEAGKLKFQLDGTEKPPNLPTLEEVQKILAARGQ